MSDDNIILLLVSYHVRYEKVNRYAAYIEVAPLLGAS